MGASRLRVGVRVKGKLNAGDMSGGEPRRSRSCLPSSPTHSTAARQAQRSIIQEVTLFPRKCGLLGRTGRLTTALHSPRGVIPVKRRLALAVPDPTDTTGRAFRGYKLHFQVEVMGGSMMLPVRSRRSNPSQVLAPKGVFKGVETAWRKMAGRTLS